MDLCYMMSKVRNFPALLNLVTSEIFLGGMSMISVMPGPASTVNNVFFKFLNRLPHHRSDLVAPESSIRDRMRMAMSNLAELTGDPDMPSLDPLCSLSFCCLTPDVIKGQNDLLKHYHKGEAEALSPAGPLRTYDDLSLILAMLLCSR